MKKLVTGIALLALAGCSASDDGAAKDEGKSSAASGLPGNLPEDATPGVAQRYLTSLTNPQQAGPWAPRDGCIAEPGALEFREKLAAAVLAKDADALAALADANIKLDFGGGGGTAELKKRLSDPDQALWKALTNLVPLGCALNPEGGLTVPWYFAQDMKLDDPYLSMVVRGVDVPLLDAPKADAKIVKRLSWDVVEVQNDPGAYAEVKAADGKKGFVEADKLRSIIDYRLLADKGADGWKLSAFVAGD